MINSIKPTKLKIQAYSGKGHGTKKGSAMEVYSNPAEIKHTFTFAEIPIEDGVDNFNTLLGAALERPPTTRIPKLSLILQFDGTGILYDNKKKDVGQQIEEFLDYVHHVKIGKPNDPVPYQIEVTWGRINFKGWMTELAIDYKLFKPNGLPLRAIVNLTLSQTVKSKKITKVADIEKVETYETLTGSLMSALKSGNAAKAAAQGAKLAYETAKKGAIAGIHLNEVARQNNLPHFRNVTAGNAITVVKDDTQKAVKPLIEIIKPK